jgi:hypothetical protein
MGTLHRLPIARRDPERESDARGLDLALAGLLGLLWFASVVRVSAAASAREVFGTEATLAFVSMLAIPWLAVRAWLRGRRRAARHGLAPLSSLSRGARRTTRTG